ncbi:MAG: pyridine nucleotide-disulfide oxidoreductase [Desulfobacterales bacterium]|nr:MAG: pyridine nucleotide-disulfide oxidoreductase [Desulfobacterales bacterium]
MAHGKLVLIGGGHAHMVTLSSLGAFIENGYGVTVIQPSDYHYYSGMGPGMLGGTYAPDHIRFQTRKVVEDRGGRFIRDKVRAIDPKRRVVLLEGADEEIPYDVLSCNAGSYVPGDMAAKDDPAVFTAKPIERLLDARSRILEQSRHGPQEVAVAGGGPSSLEIAGNIWQIARETGDRQIRIRIFAGTELMGRFPRKIRRLAHRLFHQRGIDIIEGSYVKETGQGRVRLEDGRVFSADLLFLAVGVKPSRIFADSDLPVGPDGGLLVNKYLQSTAYPDIFGGGDCIHFQPQPLDKVGVYAVRQNPVLRDNLMAALKGDPLTSFDPGGDYLLIYNMGGGEGIFYKWSVIFGGKPAFWIKDYIDRKFIRTFQAVE